MEQELVDLKVLLKRSWSMEISLPPFQSLAANVKVVVEAVPVEGETLTEPGSKLIRVKNPPYPPALIDCSGFFRGKSVESVDPATENRPPAAATANALSEPVPRR